MLRPVGYQIAETAIEFRGENVIPAVRVRKVVLRMDSRKTKYENSNRRSDELTIE